RVLRELVPRRPAADDVHQEVAEQPRLREPARPGAAVARPVRLGVPRARLRGLPDHPPPPPGRTAAGAADAGTADPPHAPPQGRAVHVVRRGREGLPGPLPVRGQGPPGRRPLIILASPHRVRPGPGSARSTRAGAWTPPRRPP